MERNVFLLLTSGLILLERTIFCKQGRIWALLTAGSYGWENYRHQADICHTYQILKSSGIPDENIIVMMYDDIVCHIDNPTPDEIINSPDGPNVYKNVPKDYYSNYVSATNFLYILSGDKNAMDGISNGKVIESGPHDVIFVSFVGHGGPGLLSFPEDNLFIGDLLQTIDWMYDNEKYLKLIIYVEASQAGSLFDKVLPYSKNVYALTAAGPRAHSFAFYWDELRETYLSDLFTNLWMSYTENESISNFFDLYDEFDVNISRAQEYGDLNIGVKKLKTLLRSKNKLVKKNPNLSLKTHRRMDTTDNMDVLLTILQNKLKAAKDSDTRNNVKSKIKQIFDKRKVVDQLFNDILTAITNNMFNPTIQYEKLDKGTEALTRNKFSCYKKLITTFYKKCGSVLEDPYNHLHLQKFVNICSNRAIRTDKVIKAIIHACADYPSHEAPKNSSCLLFPGTVRSFLCPENVKVSGECIIEGDQKGKAKSMIVCEEGIMNIKCGPYGVINIMDATWGRFDRTTCGTYPDLHRNCTTIDDTYPKLRERCHGKRHCSINATIKEFGDPCIYIAKYLTVKYLCKKVPASSIKLQVLGKDEEKQIQCPKESWIFIIDAIYASTPDPNPDWTDIRFSENHAVDIVSVRCDYRRECELKGKKDWFGIIFTSFDKYVLIQYRCIKDKIKHIRACDNETEIITCPPSSQIHIVEGYYGRSHPYMCMESKEVWLPLMSKGCNIRNMTSKTIELCHGKENCSFNYTNGDICVGLRKYYHIKYFCKGRDEPDIPTDDGDKFDVSPGVPIVVIVTADSVTFQIPEETDSALYVVQIKSAVDVTWFDAIKYPSAFQPETITDLMPNKLYDIRITLKNCKCCEDVCVPYIRFATKDGRVD